MKSLVMSGGLVFISGPTDVLALDSNAAMSLLLDSGGWEVVSGVGCSDMVLDLGGEGSSSTSTTSLVPLRDVASKVSLLPP